MSLDDKMNQAVTVRIPQMSGDEPVYARDAAGGAVPVFDDVATTMYLEPQQRSARGGEVEDDRETAYGQWMGLGRLDVDWSPHCEVVYGDTVLEVFGTLRPLWNPTTHAFSHVEMDLREVE